MNGREDLVESKFVHVQCTGVCGCACPSSPILASQWEVVLAIVVKALIPLLSYMVQTCAGRVGGGVGVGLKITWAWELMYCIRRDFCVKNVLCVKFINV